MIALVALIVISIFRSRIVESIILGSAVMDEYKFVNQSASVKAYTLPPAYPDKINFQPPLCRRIGKIKEWMESRKLLPR